MLTKEQIEEIVKEYIKENLSIRVDVGPSSGRYQESICVKIYVDIEGELVDSAGDSYEFNFNR